MKTLSSLLLGGLCLLNANPLWAFDQDKEKRLANQIADYIFDGDVVYLDADGHRFLSILMEAETPRTRGAVILMHGRGLHPNWNRVIHPLRTGLPGHGWHTLSIQMPVLGNQSTFYDYLDILPESFPRIQAAIDYLKKRDIERIVLLAHSCSVHMSIAWLHKKPHPNVIGYVGVGMGSTDKGQPMPEPFPLQDLDIPILDIRGELDYPAVHGNAPRRWQRIQQTGQERSRQRVVPGADHYFTDRGDVLLKEVADWLSTLD